MPGPAAPDPLRAALARRAAATPEEPWLFVPAGGDWRWISWREGAAADGAGAGLPPAVAEILRAPDAGELIAAAGALEVALPRQRALGRSRREVVVLGADLAERADRIVFAWALQAGAALLLEPEAAAVVATALWARPTLFHGDAVRLAAFRRQAAGTPRAALRRLHSLVLTGPAPLGHDDLAFWSARGAVVVPLPAEGAGITPAAT